MSCGASTAIMGDFNITASSEWCSSLCWHSPVVPFHGQQQQQVIWLEHTDPIWIRLFFWGGVTPRFTLSIVQEAWTLTPAQICSAYHCTLPQAAPVCNDLLGFPYTIFIYLFCGNSASIFRHQATQSSRGCHSSVRLVSAGLLWGALVIVAFVGKEKISS